jgi:hypothetical protein
MGSKTSDRGSCPAAAHKSRSDPAFAATVNTGETYRVFLTPNGDCKGFYVAGKTAGGFAVRELGGGSSSISFDDRIVAKRLGYESARMEEVTDHTGNGRQRRERVGAAEVAPVAPQRVQPARAPTAKPPQK